MIWFIVFTALFVLLSLTALVSWYVLYIQFCNSVEKRWASQILNLLHDAERCARSENRELQKLKSERDAKARSIHEQAFASHLCDYSVNELEAYPGIGPGTVGKLRAAGFVNLAMLRNARIQIHGLGEKRLSDIDYAIRDLLSKARRTFEAGGCRQAQTLADKTEALSAQYDRLEGRARARIGAAKKFIDCLGETVERAQGVAFWRWFRPISNEPLVPSEILEAPLPDLETMLRAAEQGAVASRTAKRPQEPVNPVPALPISSRSQTVPNGQSAKQGPTVEPLAESKMPDETHLLLMELTIQFALAVARADGPVTWTERELIHQHIRNRFSYNRALLNRAEAYCTLYETAAIDLERCIGEINGRFKSGHRTALMELAGQIVAVSGKEARRAAPFLHGLAQRLGVPPAALPQTPDRPDPSLLSRRDTAVPAVDLQPYGERMAQSLVPPKQPTNSPPGSKSSVPQKPPIVRVAAAAPSVVPRPSNPEPVTLPQTSSTNSPLPTRPATPPPKPAAPTRDECLSVLEILPSTPLSADLVRRQWNLLSERSAPQKAASWGPEFVKLAETKLAKIRQAAEFLLEPMGEKLETKPPAPPAKDLRHNPDLDDVFGGM